MIKNETIEVVIEDIGSNGEGIAKVDGRAIFIRGALKGEKVLAKIILIKQAFAVAILVKILATSPKRVSPLCPSFNKCGGCSLQHLDYAEQLEYKREQVANNLKKIANLVVHPQIVGSPNIYRYRNKLSLPVRAIPSKTNANEFAIGFFAANSHRVVEIDDCFIQEEWAKALIKAVYGHMKEYRMSGYDEETNRGDIRHIVARRVGEVTFVTIVCTRDYLSGVEAFKARLAVIFGEKYALFLNVNDKKNNVIMGDKFVHLGGETEAMSGETKVNVHPMSFFQVNDGVRMGLYSAVNEFVASGNISAATNSAANSDNELGKSFAKAKPIIIDAYSGAGMLTAMLAKGAQHVYGIEIVKEATESANRLMAANGVQNVTNINGDCLTELPKLLETLSVTDNEIILVLDPPRAGCDKALMELISTLKLTKIVYVSCSPSTLARDLWLLGVCNYDATVVCYDMFPHTPHVETLVALSAKIQIADPMGK